jgi:hypothetical protein
MMNKLLLAMIALGLCANVWITLIRPVQGQQSCDLAMLTFIQQDLHALVRGDCSNRKICN